MRNFRGSAVAVWLCALLLFVAGCSSATSTPVPTSTTASAAPAPTKLPNTPSPSPAPTLTPTATAGPPVKMTFMAGFQAQADLPFVAAYVAKEKGFFREQGLDVDIKHSTGNHLQLLLSGDVDITTAAADSVLNRRSDPGAPIKAIVLFGQKGQQAYAVLESSGIKTLKDFEGKTFGYRITPPPDYIAMLKTAGVDRSKINEVRVSFDPRILSEGKVDILAVFKSNEPDTLKSLGFPTRIFDPAALGVPTLGLTYIVQDSYIQQQPDRTKRFLKAALKGLEYARDHEEETLDIVMKYAPQADREHQRFLLREGLKDSVSELTAKNGLGWMTEAQWGGQYDVLFNNGGLPKAVDYHTAYDDQFLRSVYANGKLIWP